MTLLQRWRGGLIVSVQAAAGSPLDEPVVLAALASAAEQGGAAGLRMAGVENIVAARRRTKLPMIGLIKRRVEGFEPYITPTLADVAALLAVGVEVIAVDATARARPDGSSVAQIIAAICAGGALAMADCARAEDGLCAYAAGAQILATTLCGYTPGTQGTALPAYGLLAELRELETFLICEGGLHGPQDVRRAMAAHADAVVVGTALTDISWRVREFAAAATI
ncbi:MAG: N-acetylmannosamine-6-phosphate 2-epimerase [Vulcanimicrobiaceae bacterium]